MTHHTRSTHSTDTQFAIRHKCFTLSGFGQYKEGIGTLKANGGDIGGGQKCLSAPRQSGRYAKSIAKAQANNMLSKESL